MLALIAAPARSFEAATADDTARFLAGLPLSSNSPLAPYTKDPAWQQHARFSNRPFGVKRFQTIHHHCSVDVTHGLVLLFGIGTKALPSWDSGTRWNNLFRGLTVID